MNGPIASDQATATALAALGTNVLGSDDTELLKQAVILAANLIA